MTIHRACRSIKSRTLTLLATVLCVMLGTHAQAETKSITVNVDPGETYEGNVGAGFALIENTATQLDIYLTSSNGTIKESELVACSAANWAKVDSSETHWRCTGIGPNDPFWCILRCKMAYPGEGGTGEVYRWMSVSDVDFDADIPTTVTCPMATGVAQIAVPSRMLSGLNLAYSTVLR